jgi:APA family basic amino acid/polyamine antiporter
MSGTYSQLLDYVIFTALIFYIMTIGGLFIFRKKYPDIPRPYKTMGYPYIPLIYCVIALFIAINMLILKPFYAWAGLIIVMAGIPVYIFWKRSGSIGIETEIAAEE